MALLSITTTFKFRYICTSKCLECKLQMKKLAGQLYVYQEEYSQVYEWRSTISYKRVLHKFVPPNRLTQFFFKPPLKPSSARARRHFTTHI